MAELQKDPVFIKYDGKQITLFSDNRADYINLTEMAKAWKRRRSIKSWLKNKQTLDFLDVWERKYNPDYDGAQLGTIKKIAKDPTTSLSIKHWIELTNAKGIFTRIGGLGGTYAHKDIAIRFAGWLSPEFELYLVEEIQKLKELERKKDSYELLTHDQVLLLTRLKEVFKYVAHQEVIEDAHKAVFAAGSGAKNPFAAFNVWRNKILDIEAKVIDLRIKEYCKENNIPITKKMLKKSRRDKVLMLDSYDAVRNAVWDFLEIQQEVNALNLANLVRDMIRTEKGEVLRKNETDLFHQKQDLGEFNNFETTVNEMPPIRTARQVLEYRKQQAIGVNKPSTKFDKSLKTALGHNPREEEE